MAKFTRIGKVASAYILASAFSVPAGLIGTLMLRAIWPYTPLDNILLNTGTVWMIVAGWPSLIWANRNLARTLGVQEPVVIRTGGSRNIPVAGAMTDAVISIFGPKQPQPHRPLYIAHEIIIQRGSYIVGEKELKQFLTVAWNRQSAGLPPFSRTYWVEQRPHRMIRHRYNLIMETLTAHGHIQGRTQGGSGYLVDGPAGLILAQLRLDYG